MNDEEIKRAKDTIGDGQPDDYILSPSRHAEELQAKAPTLARILRTSRVVCRASQYERFDGEANLAQSTYKRIMRYASWAILATAVLSTAVLLVGPLAGLLGQDAASGLLLSGLGLAALVTGALATMFLSRARGGGLYKAWKTARARAEQARAGYFQAVAAAPGEAPADPALGLLKLEYIRRYHLDVQIAYYRERSKQHRASAERTLDLASLAALPTALAAGAVGVLGPQWAPLAALGLLGSALAAFATAREQVNSDQVNADSYDATLTEMEWLKEDIDDWRNAVLQATNAADVLAGILARIQQVLGAEHEKWLARGTDEDAVKNLEAAVAAAQARRTAGGDG